MAFTVKKQAKLNFKKNTTFKIPRTGIQVFLPSSLSGLSLWLKADAGITTFRNTYASQIILNGAYNTDFNGTYTATSEPDGNGDYSLNGPVYAMTYNKSANEYVVAFNSQYNAGSFISNDGVNWSILTPILNPAPYISGITNYSNGNGQYSYAGDDPRDPSYSKSDNENYYFIGGGAGNWTLTYYEFGGGATVLATNSNTIPNGSWTNVNATGTITSTATLYPQGSSPTGSITTSEYGNFFVTEWADQSGNSIVLTPDIQNAPTFVSSFLNGKPVIEFIANDNTGLSNVIFGLTGFTFFSVAKQKPTNGGRIFSSYFGNVLIGTWGNYSNRFYGGEGNGWLAEGTQTSTDFLITTAFSDADTSFDFSQNGVSQSSGNSDSTVILNGISVGGGIWNGGNEEASDSYVCEIIIYNRTLTLTERQQVEVYLNQKYAIY
jgi:hypothetical protein